jgi:quercetin dioxygenase-like cupin family protein
MTPSGHPSKDIEAQGYATHIWSHEPNYEYGIHNHPYDKIIVVLEGSIRFDMPKQKTTHRLAAGDSLSIPAGTIHSALVGPEGVTCLEGQK